MKVTNRLTHIATKVNFETAKTEDQLKAAFEAKGIAGFPAMLDIKERTEEHVQFISLDDLLAFAKASGVAAVTYDVTYFPHADQGEVERQLTHSAATWKLALKSLRTCVQPRFRSTWILMPSVMWRFPSIASSSAMSTVRLSRGMA